MAFFSSAPETARAATSALNNVVDNQKANVFWANPFSATDTTIRDYTYLNPINSPINSNGWNSEFQWEIGKQATVATKFVIRSNFAAIPLAAGSTYARYCDFIGVAAYQLIGVYYGSNTIYEYDGDYIYYRAKKYLPWDKARAWYELVKGEKTAAERSVLTQAGFRTYTNLMIPNSFLRGQCWRLVALSQKLRVCVRTRRLGEVLQTDAGSTGGSYSTITTPMIQPQLGVDFYHLNDGVAATLVEETLTDRGVAHMVFYPSFGPMATIASNVNGATFSYKLSRSGVMKTMYFTLHFSDFFDSGQFLDHRYLISNNPTPIPPNTTIVPYNPIGAPFMTGSGVNYIKPGIADYEWQLFAYNPENHSCLSGDNIFFFTASLDTEAENTNYGNVTLSNIDDLTLYIVFSNGGTGTTALGAAQNLRIRMYNTKINFISVQLSEYTRIFDA